MRQMLWGFFMKMAVADRCGWYVDQVWADYTHCSSGQLVMAAVLFAVQIYGDFAGYSNIAIGCAKLFGINLRQNFRTPYFSRDIAEFWRRWHISLTTWFRDYLYIPLGGSRVSRWKVVRNTFIIFLVSGLWHGANWTFVAWGGYNALLFLPLILTHRNRKYTDTVAEGRLLPSIGEVGQMLLTFTLCVIGWILFRAGSIDEAFLFTRQILCPGTGMGDLKLPWLTIVFITVMTVVEWIGRNHEHGLDIRGVKPVWLRATIYYALAVAILLFSIQSENFIYFQF